MNQILKIMSLFFFGLFAVGIAYLYITRMNDRVVGYLRTKCPAIIRKQMEKRRLKKIELQLTDGVTMLANGLKAGLSLQQTIDMSSQNAPHPLDEEFAHIISEVRMGKNVEDALLELRRRVPLDDVNILVESVLVLRQTGGNLIETFQSLVETIRERQKVVGKIRVMTTQGIAQAVIILIMPFALGIGLYIISPWFIMPLITEPLGWFLILLALMLQLVGGLWLKKIATIRV